MPRAGWISLNEYANKYKVSLSTLRRRIRSAEIEHELEGGRYWLPNKPIEIYQRNRPQVESIERMPEGIAAEGTEDALLLARTMLADLKAAYKHSLQEKEEQILQLKEEIADLKTLVKILETTNKPRTSVPQSTDVESWS